MSKGREDPYGFAPLFRRIAKNVGDDYAALWDLSLRLKDVIVALDREVAGIKCKAMNLRRKGMKDNPDGRFVLEFWGIERQTTWERYSLLIENRPEDEIPRSLAGFLEEPKVIPADAPNVTPHPNDGEPRAYERKGAA